MKKLSNVFVFFAIAGMFWSCNKEKVEAKSKTDLLTLNPWHVDQADFNPGFTNLTIYKKNATNNVYDVSKVILTFQKDGSISATDLDGKGISGKWAFNADQSKITLPPGLPFNEININTLTEKNFDITVPAFSAAVLGQTVSGILTVKMIPKFN
jgi:hypothetical protein